MQHFFDFTHYCLCNPQKCRNCSFFLNLEVCNRLPLVHRLLASERQPIWWTLKAQTQLLGLESLRSTMAPKIRCQDSQYLLLSTGTPTLYLPHWSFWSFRMLVDLLWALRTSCKWNTAQFWSFKVELGYYGIFYFMVSGFYILCVNDIYIK